jgi:serine/threonine protein kinase
MDSGQQLFSAGSRVGPYLVLEKLGEGGMSEVFKAIEPTLERYVAIKIMHRTNRSSPEVMANFLEEACPISRWAISRARRWRIGFWPGAS